MARYENVVNDNYIPLKIIEICLPEGKKTVDELNSKYIGSGMTEEHWHRSMEIVLPVLGETYIDYEGKTSVLKHGELCIIPSNTKHNVYSKSNETYLGYCLQIDYDYLVSNINDYDKLVFHQIDNLSQREEVLRAIYAILSYQLDKDDYNYLRIKSKVLELLYLIVNYGSSTNELALTIKSEKHKDQLLAVIDYLNANYQNDLNIDDVARHFDFSYGYISKLFKDSLGITIKNYITMIRLTHSVDDLMNTDLPIIQIALQNGFPNSKSFYKEFENKYQMTPSLYRKKMVKPQK